MIEWECVAGQPVLVERISSGTLVKPAHAHRSVVRMPSSHPGRPLRPPGFLTAATSAAMSSVAIDSSRARLTRRVTGARASSQPPIMDGTAAQANHRHAAATPATYQSPGFATVSRSVTRHSAMNSLRGTRRLPRGIFSTCRAVNSMDFIVLPHTDKGTEQQSRCCTERKTVLWRARPCGRQRSAAAQTAECTGDAKSSTGHSTGTSDRHLCR